MIALAAHTSMIFDQICSLECIKPKKKTKLHRVSQSKNTESHRVL